jgi:hypothetical protein
MMDKKNDDKAIAIISARAKMFRSLKSDKVRRLIKLHDMGMFVDELMDVIKASDDAIDEGVSGRLDYLTKRRTSVRMQCYNIDHNIPEVKSCMIHGEDGVYEFTPRTKR